MPKGRPRSNITDEERRVRKNAYALAYYYKKKALKKNQQQVQTHPFIDTERLNQLVNPPVKKFHECIKLEDIKDLWFVSYYLKCM